MTPLLWEFLKDVHQGLRSLIYPQICIMCGMHPGEICSGCEKSWTRPPSFTRFNEVPSVSIAMYEFGVSNVILKAKEERNKCAQKIIATSLFRAISFLKPKEVQDFVIVPIPSTPQAIRKRGESFLQPILDLVIQQAAHVGEKWYWRELLVHSKKVRDQAGLTSQQRDAYMRGDENALPPRDKGPVRKFIRNYVDSRRSIGEFFLPIIVLVLFMTLIPLVYVQFAAIALMYSALLFSVIDGFFLSRRIKREVSQRFPDAPLKGLGMYGWLRSTQIRRLRAPLPQVKRGEKI